MSGDERWAAARVGVILAGGASRRMPGGKAGALLGGTTLLDHAIAAVRAAGLEAVVCARADTMLPPHDARTIVEPDRPGAPHPLRGIAASLQELGRPIVVLPVDLPFVPPAALAALARRTDRAALIAAHDRPAALLARVTPPLAAPLDEAADAGAGVLRTLLREGARLVDVGDVGIDDATLALMNVNAPGDLAAAEARRAQRSG